MSRAAAAKALGVTPQRINRWVADGAPVARRGRSGLPHRYNVGALRRWRAARDKGRQESGLSLEAERAALTRAQRVKVERENRVGAGELVEVDEVERDFAACANAVKARLRRVPAAVADRVVSAALNGPGAVKALLLDAIDDALRELSTRSDTKAGAA